MKTANIRELKHATSTVLDWVANGQKVEITRRNEVVGVIIPPDPARSRHTKANPPDFYQRLEALFHDTSKPMTGTETVSYSRGER